MKLACVPKNTVVCFEGKALACIMTQKQKSLKFHFSTQVTTGLCAEDYSHNLKRRMHTIAL